MDKSVDTPDDTRPARQFDAMFKRLTGHDPFPWQRKLYERLMEGKVPSSCDIPTGLGKTSVVAVWLIALAERPDKLPRRLVYVVNRRTVVDQTTNEVEKLRTSLKDAGLWEALRKLCAIPLHEDEPPLAISTLRGQFADNREWSADPARPAVIVGTVDMIGSRLLFSGYGVGFKAKPLHAGFLGQDVLLVHDEAHLEPAFQQLMETIACEQDGGRLDEKSKCVPVANRPKDYRPLRVMELTATTRNDNGQDAAPEVTLTEADRTHPIVKQRIEACKHLIFTPVEDDRQVAQKIAQLALERRRLKDENGDDKDANAAVLVFVRTLDDVKAICDKLADKKTGVSRDHVQQLTGTMRGFERDRMANPRQADACRIFARFLRAPKPDADEHERWKIEPMPGTVYLVCTSAGEVGIDISADHMVCDLSTFESMAQRFGRVNRFGDRTDAEIHVVHPNEFEEKDPYEQARRKTLALLQQLDGDGSPAALGKLDPAARTAAFAPEPTILPATDILFDAWAMTTIRDKLPGRPPVEPYLHGITDRDPPETYVAWREEVWQLDPRRDQKKEPLFGDEDERREFEKYAEALLDDYPLKPHELLRDSTFRKNSGVRATLTRLAEGWEHLPVWIQDLDGSVSVVTLADLADADLGNRTVLLPPQAGGLSRGMLTTDPYDPGKNDYDVADEWYEDAEKKVGRRVRVWNDDPEFESKTKGMRLIRRLDFPVGEEDEYAEGRSWHWYELPRAADNEGSKSAQEPVRWDNHTNQVTNIASRIATALGLPQELQEAMDVAAKFHDLGKKREVWQRSIGNPNPTDWHAKSGRHPVTGRLWKPWEICPDYRHEFGSLLDTQSDPEFQKLHDELKDLVLHLIAASHGRGRPHFPHDEALDVEPKGRDEAAIAADVPRRFARLQRKYGRWGLAYLESLLRAADWTASAEPSATVEDEA